MSDPTTLSYWLPKLERASLPVPETHIIYLPSKAKEEAAWGLFDGKPHGKALEVFAQNVGELCFKVGFPAFLRTGITSGKHQWDKTCHVQNENFVLSHIIHIAEFSECAGMMGLPWNEWVVRKFLKAKKVYGVCPTYQNMPVTKEFRFFVRDNKVLCAHPYWPEHALVQGGFNPSAEEYADLCDMGESKNLLYDLASRAGAAVGGEWSVDLFEAEDGWYVTDMAEAKKSWHWEGCPNSKQLVEENPEIDFEGLLEGKNA